MSALTLKRILFSTWNTPGITLPTKADWLNGWEHDYKKAATIPEEYAVLRTMCGHEKTDTEGVERLEFRGGARLHRAESLSNDGLAVRPMNVR